MRRSRRRSGGRSRVTATRFRCVAGRPRPEESLAGRGFPPADGKPRDFPFRPCGFRRAHEVSSLLRTARTNLASQGSHMRPDEVSGDLVEGQGDFTGLMRCPIPRHALFQVYADASHPAPADQFLVRRGSSGLEGRENIPREADTRLPDQGWESITRPFVCCQCRSLGFYRVFDPSGRAIPPP
jgi:hypothetical protein